MFNTVVFVREVKRLQHSKLVYGICSCSFPLTLNTKTLINLWFSSHQVTSSYSDMCSFLEPMARLIRGNCFIDFFHYEDKDDMVVEHKENLAVSMHKYTDFYPFRPCVFMGFSVSCPNKPLEVLRVTYNSKSDMRKPPKVCKNGNWVSNKWKLTNKL